MPKRTTSYQDWLMEKLADPARAAHYLNAAHSDSRAAFLKALRRVFESHRMKELAEKVGVSRESLYRMTSETGNPTYASLNGILDALGLKMLVAPKDPEQHRRHKNAKNLKRTA